MCSALWPACGSAALREKDESGAEDVVRRCTGGLICPAQAVERLKHFCSRLAMDIEGLGIRVAEQLVSAGLVHDVSDLYALGREHLQQLEGFGEKRAKNLLDALDVSRRRPFWRVLVGLGIREVGSQVAQVLERHYESIDALMQAGEAELTEIEGIGPVMQSVCAISPDEPLGGLVLERYARLRRGVWTL